MLKKKNPIKESSIISIDLTKLNVVIIGKNESSNYSRKMNFLFFSLSFLIISPLVFFFSPIIPLYKLFHSPNKPKLILKNIFHF
jgi:hypothetical protein